MPGLDKLPEGMVAFLPPVDYAESLALMRSAHLLVVIDAPTDTSVFLPSKLVDYVGAERPILALSPPGATATLANRLGGLVAHPDDVGGAAAALGRALGDLRSRDADRWGRPAVREEYDARRVAAAFDAIMTAATAP
jgi:hypothetical protein